MIKWLIGVFEYILGEKGKGNPHIHSKWFIVYAVWINSVSGYFGCQRRRAAIPVLW